MNIRALLVSVVSAGVICAACGSQAHPHRPVAADPGPIAGQKVAVSTSTTAPKAKPAPTKPIKVSVAGIALTPFDSCPALLQDVRAEAEAEVTPYGLQTPMPYYGGATPIERAGGGVAMGTPMPEMAPSAAGAPESAMATSGSAGATSNAIASDSAGGASGVPAFSGTNNQEAGVDEPDIVKTDGRIIVTLTNSQTLRVVDVTGSTPKARGSLTFSNGSESGMFLVGTDAVVLGSSYPTPVPVPEPPVPAPGPVPTTGPVPPPPVPQPEPAVPPAGYGSGGTAGSSGGGTGVASPGVVSSPPAVSSSGPDVAMPAQPIQPYQSNVTVSVVSLSDPDHPSITHTYSVSGSEVDARLIGTSIKLVTSTEPQIVFPQTGSVDANRQAIAAAPLSAWLPTVTGTNGKPQTVGCDTVQHAPYRSGTGMVTVTAIDPSKPEPTSSASVLGDPGVVYASTTHLYIAANDLSVQNAIASNTPVGGERTIIHDFDISNPSQTTYVGSGAVAGIPLNQYALSEYNGNLRIATTTGIPQPAPNEGSPVPAADGSQSLVTILKPSGDTLTQIGQVAGLGLTQRVYGVRFVGPQGYVVTFRQLDPLYVLDLSDPTHPALKGALELTGYSSYLDPVGNGLLIGIGEAADDQAHPIGVQVSLFNVTDPSHPSLVDKDVIPNGYTPIDGDPHAFLYWAADHLAVVPVTAYTEESSTDTNGALTYQVSSSGLKKTATIPGVGQQQVQRSVVIGSTLYTISAGGVQATDLGSMASRGAATFS